MRAAPFFKRILQDPESESEGETMVQVERRRAPRFAIHPDFPVKAVLSVVGRDDTGAPMSNSRHAWHWKGRLIDISEQGARMELGPGIRARTGDTCDLIISVGDFELSVPCHISNFREQDGGTVYGLKHDIADEATWTSYSQLLEVVALGSALKLSARLTKPDESGFLVEQYASDRPARLTVWRFPRDKSVAAFEFLLKDSLVRVGAGHDPEYLAGTDATAARPAPMAKASEIFRLFQWVVPNLARCVPPDVRLFLQQYA
ncbi:MAG: PilZ domain-containing protein [Opitutae bacterium]|nr:PilZ domain-containing protein [Opitutae bacterium]